jgi:phosphoglycolate phosphatase-like HAD superfamily hydrolase
VIGDTVRDIECARFVNAKAFAVATGGHSLSKLEAAGPDLIVKDFTKMEVPFHHYLSDRIQ